MVLEGNYRTNQVSYKKNVLDYFDSFHQYATKLIPLDENLNLVYKNMEYITICMVNTKSVDINEAADFLKKFERCIVSEWSSGSSNASEDNESLLSPFNSSSA